MNEILLTGATGFLGSKLAESLLAANYNVTAIVRPSSNLWRIERIVDDLTVIRTLDPKDVFINGKKFNIAIHAATCYGKHGETWEISEANYRFPLRILQMLDQQGGGTFINTDTFFSKDNLLHDHLPEYTLTKRKFKNDAMRIFQKSNIKFVNIILEHLYGPGDAEDKFATMIIRKLVENVETLDLTCGHQKRDFIYIDDAVEAFLFILPKIMEAPQYSEYGIGTGLPVSIRYFVENAKIITRSTTKLCYGALPDRKREILTSFANNSSILNLGWTPKCDLTTGISTMLNEYILKRK